MKISYIRLIVLFSLAIPLLLFASSQELYPSSTPAVDKDINQKKSHSSPGNFNLVGTTAQNTGLNKLIFSYPFYFSNDTLILDKIPIVENSSAATNIEVQFFVERGFINASLVTYNVGYYIEDPNFSGSNSNSNSLEKSHEAGSTENYAKGSGIFLTENGDIIKWDAFDQIIDKSKDTFHYAGIIFFSSSFSSSAAAAADAANSKANALSFLTNQVGLYEFSIDSKNTTTTSTSNHIDTATDNTTTTNPQNTTDRTIWLWPNTY